MVVGVGWRKEGGEGGEGSSHRSFINTQMCSQTHNQTRTQSHTFFNPAGEWGVGNDRGGEKEMKRGRRVGPRFLITPSAHSEDIPIR